MGIMTKLLTLVLGLSGVALSVSALAETAKPAPTAQAPTVSGMAKGLKAPTRKKSWSLKPSGEQDQQEAAVVGPPVPAPQRQVIPVKKVRKKPVDVGGGIKRVDATPVARQMINKQRAQNRH
jgi:hypothetical protein